MTLTQDIARADAILPFQLDASDTRGRIARLDGVLQDILNQHEYPPAVEALVAEMALLTVLIGQMIQLRWKLSLQVQTNGPVRMIATDYFAPETEGAPARIRAYAGFDRDRVTEAAPFSQLGDGYFAVLIDQGPGSDLYRGITPIAGTSLCDCAGAYFAQSEQIPTRFALTFGRSTEAGRGEHWRAGGIMIQHLPGTPPRIAGDDRDEDDLLLAQGAPVPSSEDNWNRVNAQLEQVEALELVGPSVALSDLLLRLFPDGQPRVFPLQLVQFGCTCSEERVRRTLSIYSARDIARMTTPEGVVTADCQFCGAHYVLDPATVGFDAMRSEDDR